MSLRRLFPSAIAVLGLAVLVGCGGSSTKITPPPSGGFSNSDLNGTYVFSTLGTDANGAPISIVGAFTACGCSSGASGTISGGTLSYNDGSLSPLFASNQPISGGSYSITVDGRGQVQLTTSSALGTVGLDIVLSSSNGGSVTEYDTTGTGSGTLDLQSTVSQSDLAGSYAFSVGGASSAGAIFASAGAFTLDTTGAVTTGVQDVTTMTTAGVAASTPNSQIETTSSVVIGTGTAPGTAQISNANGGIYTFDVYPISASHLKFLETDGLDLTSGDVFTQQTSLPSGTLAFTMGGDDTNIDPLALGGLLTNSSGSVTGTEDYNVAGTVDTTPVSFTGGFSVLAGGRSVLTLNTFENGGASTGDYFFAAYPTTGGTFLLEVDNAGITSGVALVQSSTTFAASQGYGLDLSAVNISTPGSFYEEDDIAEFTTTSSGFSGAIDLNDEGTLTPDQTFTGTYASVSAGKYTFTTTSKYGFNGIFYTVDGSNVLFLETDTNQVGTGVFQAQSTPTGAAAHVGHFAAAHAHMPVKHASRRNNR